MPRDARLQSLAMTISLGSAATVRNPSTCAIPPASPPSRQMRESPYRLALCTCAACYLCQPPHPHTHQANDTASFKRHVCSGPRKTSAQKEDESTTQNVKTPNTQSVGELLLGFFACYAEHPLDQAVCVATASHVPRPGSRAFERFCIIDPLEPDEDLGRNIKQNMLPVLRRELARARLELASGTALEHMICNERYS